MNIFEASKSTIMYTIFNLIDTVKIYLKRASKDPIWAGSSILKLLLAFFLIFWYCKKFLTLSLGYISLLSDSEGHLSNPSDYSTDHMTLLLGGAILLSYLLIQNEIGNLFRRPKKWKEYISTFFGIGVFIAAFPLVPMLGFYLMEQTLFFYIGAAVTAAFVAHRNSIQEIFLLPIMLQKPSENRLAILGVGVTILPILLFIYFSTNLAAWPSIVADLVTVFCYLITIISLLWWFQISLEGANPKIQDQRMSALGFLILTPFIFYIVTRVMYVFHDPNTVTMERWNIEFAFMNDANPFQINTWPIEVTNNIDDRWRFWIAALLNSIRVTLLSIVFCTILGIIVGVSRLSSNKLTSSMATAYVEIFRNMPLAVLLFLISTQLGTTLPLFIAEENIVGMIYYSNQGIYLPGFELSHLIYGFLILFAIGAYWQIKDREGVDDSEEGVRRRFTIWVIGLAVALGIILSGDISLPNYIKPNMGIPGTWDIEEGTGFEMTVEFLAMIIGLTLFTTAVVAEIVRGSIQSLPRGQVEAAVSIGLSPYQRLRLVILPQALRSMIPLLNSQYMNVWKNSSLAMIVAYSDVFYVIFVMMNNVGKLIPLFILLLLTYQAGSLLISGIMNVYNYRVTKVKI